METKQKKIHTGLVPNKEAYQLATYEIAQSRDRAKREGWAILLESESHVVMVNDRSDLQSFRTVRDFGQVLVHENLSSKEVGQIWISITPKELVGNASAIGAYTLGGVMLGGIAGAVVGAAMDVVARGILDELPRKVEVDYYFQPTGAWLHSHLSFHAVNGRRMILSEQNVEELFELVGPQIEALQRYRPRAVTVNGCVLPHEEKVSQQRTERKQGSPAMLAADLQELVKLCGVEVFKEPSGYAVWKDGRQIKFCFDEEKVRAYLTTLLDSGNEEPKTKPVVKVEPNEACSAPALEKVAAGCGVDLRKEAAGYAVWKDGKQIKFCFDEEKVRVYLITLLDSGNEEPKTKPVVEVESNEACSAPALEKVAAGCGVELRKEAAGYAVWKDGKQIKFCFDEEKVRACLTTLLDSGNEEPKTKPVVEVEPNEAYSAPALEEVAAACGVEVLKEPSGYAVRWKGGRQIKFCFDEEKLREYLATLRPSG